MKGYFTPKDVYEKVCEIIRTEKPSAAHTPSSMFVPGEDGEPTLAENPGAGDWWWNSETGASVKVSTSGEIVEVKNV